MEAENKNVPRTPPTPRSRAAWRAARELIWRHRRRLALGLLLLLIGQLAGLVLPFSARYFAEDVIGHKRADLLWPLAAAIAAASVVKALAQFALSQIVGVAAQRAIADMRKTMQQHISRLPISYFDSTQTGILISRVMSDAEGIRNLIGNGLVELIGGLITAVVAAIVLFYLNWRLTAVTLAILALFGGAMAFAFKRLRKVNRERNKVQGEVTGRLAQSLSGARVVKAYTAEKREDLVFAKGAHRLLRNVSITITGTSAVSALSVVVVGAISVAMMLIGGRDMIQGGMTVPEAVQYIVFVGMLAMPVIQIASIGAQIADAFAGLDRIHEILSMRTEEDEAGRAPLAQVKGDVAFARVWFEYKPGVPVLKDVSFTAPTGSTTALVGSSGSGKSTAIGLIMAFQRPREGKITVDGIDLCTVRLRDYRGQLGVVLQDNFLFDGTIRENIAFARPHAPLKEIEDAARVAHCLEFIESFEQKFETVVGERGIRLSGGQRQRVAIARAILADPRILILDEATSSLDSESEELIQDGLRSLRRGRTTFVIAHRLSTIRSAGQILVLEAGQIAERGTHRELMEKNGRYRELHDKQYKLEQDRFVNPGEELQSLDVANAVLPLPSQGAG